MIRVKKAALAATVALLLLATRVHAFGSTRLLLPRQSTACHANASSANVQSDNVSPLFQVIGASGRIGSLFLRQPSSIAVPRGVVSHDDIDGPIVVATPAQAWSQIRSETLNERDLTWVGNGLLLCNNNNKMRDETVVVPHFGVLKVGDAPVTNAQAPPTFVYGRHAEWVACILEKEGVRTEIVTSWSTMQYYAARKVLWASIMWLLCHSYSDNDDNTPLTVKQVHDKMPMELRNFVVELMPALSKITNTTTTAVDFDNVMEYIQSYSYSMPTAIPSKELALAEIQERNGVWLTLASAASNSSSSDDCNNDQPLHKSLLRQVGGEDALQQALQPTNTSVSESTATTTSRQGFHINSLNITMWGKVDPRTKSRPVRSAIIVGGGMIGSSIALELARRCYNSNNNVSVTVIDSLPAEKLGATTAASWAWINANQKKPLDYQVLNQLGMRGWKSNTVYAKHAVWCGSLVQYAGEKPQFLGGYPVVGPLTRQEVLDIDAHANFDYEKGEIYSFPDEACADPAAVIGDIQAECQKLGVKFLHNTNVDSLLRSVSGRVEGVCVTSNNSTDERPDRIYSDVVIVAAGVGSSSLELGALPMTHSPGMTAYAKVDVVSNLKQARLSTILVDTHRQSHVLQRKDGTIVAGGGFLEVGGGENSGLFKTPGLTGNALTDTKHDEKGHALLKAAQKLAPAIFRDAKYTHAAQAVRPIPLDGYPALGFLEHDCLYVAVTHSGVTLAPIVGAVVALEITTGVKLDLFANYRPQRLYNNNTKRTK